MRGTQIKYQIRETVSQISGQQHFCLVFFNSATHFFCACPNCSRTYTATTTKKGTLLDFPFLDRSKCGNLKFCLQSKMQGCIFYLFLDCFPLLGFLCTRGTQLKYQIRETESQIPGNNTAASSFSTPLPISFVHVPTAVAHAQQQLEQQKKDCFPLLDFYASEEPNKISNTRNRIPNSGQQYCCRVFSTPLPIFFFVPVLTAVGHAQQQQQQKKYPLGFSPSLIALSELT
ncbi:hypothetical protein CEXT_595361 [Caerostris extrusa]|uniref:Uncharacterized protein n=1 Tax=Caerostris extrusa TaxID=172846 RepID=A0AAV4RTD2_CAEEX|nr:hypothetical protein CEXT_595361 [Caerostris extrusa]